MSFYWSEEKIGTLTELWKRGDTANSIADVLGHGCTKNMVIGKARRLELGPSGFTQRRLNLSPQERVVTKKVNRSHKPKPPTLPPAAIIISEPGSYPKAVTIMALKDQHCRAIIGVTKGVPLYCGENVIRATSWCPYHTSVFFQPPKPRTRR